MGAVRGVFRSGGAFLAVAASAAGAASSSTPLDVAFNMADASYSVVVGGATWFNSSLYALRSNASWFSSTDGTLTLASATPISGQGQFGAYTGWTATWDIPAAAGVWETSVFVYSGLNAVVFEQYFPSGLSAPAIDDRADGDVCTAFPSFGPAKASLNTDLAYLTFQGGHSPPHVGRWTSEGALTASGEGGAVTAWWNASGTALVLSSLTDQATQYGGFSAALGGVFALGFNGALSGVPVGHRSQSILVAGDTMNSTFYAWGDLLLQAGGKTRTGLTSDPATAYLSAWTDNGSYLVSVECVEVA
jgi:hypothetical protein